MSFWALCVPMIYLKKKPWRDTLTTLTLHQAAFNWTTNPEYKFTGGNIALKKSQPVSWQCRFACGWLYVSSFCDSVWSFLHIWDLIRWFLNVQEHCCIQLKMCSMLMSFTVYKNCLVVRKSLHLNKTKKLKINHKQAELSN